MSLHRHVNGIHCLFLSVSVSVLLFLWLAETGKYEKKNCQFLKWSVSPHSVCWNMAKYGPCHPILHVLTCSPQLPIWYDELRGRLTVTQMSHCHIVFAWSQTVRGLGFAKYELSPKIQSALLPPCCYFCLLKGIVLTLLITSIFILNDNTIINLITSSFIHFLQSNNFKT